MLAALLTLALAGTESLPADLTGFEVSNDKAVLFVVQKEDGYVWPMKAPIKLAVEGTVAARMRLAAGAGVPMVVVRSGGKTWELATDDWVRVELDRKATITAAARANDRIASDALRVEFAPAGDVGQAIDAQAPGEVVTLELGSMPSELRGSDTALSSSSRWERSCSGFEVAGDPMITVDVPEGPGVVFDPEEQIVAVSYGETSTCLVNQSVTVPGGQRVSFYPSFTSGAGSIEQPSVSIIAVEDLSVAAAPKWSERNLATVQQEVIDAPAGEQLGYLDLPLQGEPPIVAATGCDLKWESGFRKDNRKENPGSIKAGGQRGWRPTMELPGRYVLFTQTDHMDRRHTGPCLVGIQQGPWQGVLPDLAIPPSAGVADRALSMHDPFVEMALRDDTVGDTHRRRIAETAPAAAWATIWVDRKGLTKGQPVLPVGRCSGNNTTEVLSADGVMHRIRCETLAADMAPTAWPDPAGGLQTLTSGQARSLAQGHPELAADAGDLGKEIARFESCRKEVFASHGGDTTNLYDYALTTYVNGRVQRAENYGAKIDKEAFQKCKGTQRDRTEEAFVNKVIAKETAARQATMDVVRNTLGAR